MHTIRTAFLSTLLAAMVTVPAWSATAANNTWPHFRGANRDGISTEKVTLGSEAPQQLWKAKLGTGFTSIAIANGLVYSSGNENDRDTIVCLEAKSGKVVWTFPYPQKLEPNLYEGGPNSTPTVAGDHVYILAKDGFAACLEAKTGKAVWQKNVAQETGAAKPDWGFSGSPTVEGKVLYLNVGANGCALEAATGKVVWKSGGTKAGYATPIPFTIGKVSGLLVFTSDALAAVNPMDGKVVWSHPWTTNYGVNSADPIVLGSQVFISTGYNYGCALLDFADGKPREVWRNKTMRNHFNACVLMGGHLFGFDEGTLKCIDWATGSQKWEQDGLGKGSLIAADGKLVILSERGELAIAEASASGYKELSRSQVLSGKCWTSPAIAEGRIYCRNAKGDLVCLAVK
jgi:outer membrane protein assembly factor BamB